MSVHAEILTPFAGDHRDDIGVERNTGMARSAT
jgi:hypothetical protein